MTRRELEAAHCGWCGKLVTITWAGVLRVHGPRHAHCEGSGKPWRDAR